MISKQALPQRSLLQPYARSEAYTDCYVTTVAGDCSFEAFVGAFYTSWLFKVERVILAALVAKPSSDAEALSLANNTRDTFAAWRVEARDTDQLLMCDFRDRTRSWLMVEPLENDGQALTRLFFGSAVVPLTGQNQSPARFGLAFRCLLSFHRLYARALLAAARSRLR